MTIRDQCQFCKKAVERPVDLIDGHQDPDQRLHRRYTLLNSEQLLSYLWHLEARVENIRFHVHFAQLVAFADRHKERDSLRWSSRKGRYLEAIHHLTVDAHLLPCGHQDDESPCFRIHVKVDGWSFHSFSREPRCNSCRYGDVSSWVDGNLDRRDVARSNRSRWLDNHIQACTIELKLGVDGAGFRREGQKCPVCRLLPIAPEDIVTGRSTIQVLHIEDGRCLCPFTCFEK